MADDLEREWAHLMRAANRGESQAYQALLERLTPVLRARARGGLVRAGADPSEAEDVVQETLLAIHLKRHTWREDEPIGPWISAIARYKLIDALRRRGRRAETSLESAPEPVTEPGVNDALIRRDVKRAVSHLSGRMGEVVGSVAMEGASINETASRLGVSEGAVRVALHRGLSALAARFGRQAK